MVRYFKPIKCLLLNNNVIPQRFIVHINLRLHVNDTMFGFYVFSWQVMVAPEVPSHLVAATAEINNWLPKMLSFSLDVNESKIKIIN